MHNLPKVVTNQLGQVVCEQLALISRYLTVKRICTSVTKQLYTFGISRGERCPATWKVTVGLYVALAMRHGLKWFIQLRAQLKA